MNTISIHALREEGDPGKSTKGHTTKAFLSTPSARRATRPSAWTIPSRPISIHALREEGDDDHPARGTDRRYFYPRPPRGGRQTATRPDLTGRGFLSTPSARRATMNMNKYGLTVTFLSTPSARRATKNAKIPNRTIAFLSTPSARRATPPCHYRQRKDEISIHALREEGDTKCCSSVFRAANFYPRPPRGGRLQTAQFRIEVEDISIHALREEGDPCAGVL